MGKITSDIVEQEAQVLTEDDTMVYVQVFLYLQVLDLLTTLVGFKLGISEASPFIRSLLHFGPSFAVAASKIVAVCLAGIGIYGVVAYVTASRRRDFGIRVALGASPGGLFRLATWQSLRPVLIGVGLGVLGSYWTSRWIGSLLYQTSPLDVGTILVSAGILVVMALAATMGPAARVDPAVTLRSE